ncbi:MAG: hypothetical protein JWL72_4438 [Ilumatobacteraceae bacterium]|nr:hypothetical protein [Ilumatobacteraceae bacterium]
MRTMRKQGVKVSEVAGELAILAGKSGLVANTIEGKQAFSAWLANDHMAARKALFSRVAAQRVAAAAPKVLAERVAAAPPTKYPTNWLRAAGVRAGGSRTRITQASD